MIRLENVLKTSLQDVLKMSWARLQNALKTSWRYLEEVNILKTSWRCLEDVFARRLEGILKMSWRCLEDVLKAYGQDKHIDLDQGVLKTPSRRILKMYDFGEYICLDQDVLKTCWRHLLKTKTKEAFKTSPRRLHQDECLLVLFFRLKTRMNHKFQNARAAYSIQYKHFLKN